MRNSTKYLSALAVAASGATSALLSPLRASAQLILDIDREAVESDLPGTAQVDLANKSSGFSYWFGRFLAIAMIIAAILVFVNLIMGAIKWISSGSDSGKVQEAQKQIMQSIVGLLVLAAVVAIFELLSRFLGLDFISFS